MPLHADGQFVSTIAYVCKTDFLTPALLAFWEAFQELVAPTDTPDIA
jgi:hypothetical protein